ncbi:hypothetical protein B0H19DRAFT_1176181 [Mycena capillaripes]|nr:hypothetical protein B0H19DRAFT_1176181 [Mycena capillaripes]
MGTSFCIIFALHFLRLFASPAVGTAGGLPCSSACREICSILFDVCIDRTFTDCGSEMSLSFIVMSCRPFFLLAPVGLFLSFFLSSVDLSNKPVKSRDSGSLRVSHLSLAFFSLAFRTSLIHQPLYTQLPGASTTSYYMAQLRLALLGVGGVLSLGTRDAYEHMPRGKYEYKYAVCRGCSVTAGITLESIS